MFLACTSSHQSTLCDILPMGEVSLKLESSEEVPSLDHYVVCLDEGADTHGERDRDTLQLSVDFRQK